MPVNLLGCWFIVYCICDAVTGCADLLPPPNARVDRYEDSVVVRCNLSHETWYLTCKDSVWIGTITNCSEGSAAAATVFSATSDGSINRNCRDMSPTSMLSLSYPIGALESVYPMYRISSVKTMMIRCAMI